MDRAELRAAAAQLDVIDRDGTNATASFLLNDHHDVVGEEDSCGIIDNCELCGFAAGWVQPTSLGPDERGHATGSSSAEIKAWIDAHPKDTNTNETS